MLKEVNARFRPHRKGKLELYELDRVGLERVTRAHHHHHHLSQVISIQVEIKI